MKRKVNYFEAQRIAPERDDTGISLIISAFVPTFLSSLETRASRSFWVSDEDFARAYQALKRQQWELLMDATDRIINELRAMRAGTETPIEMQDPSLNPYNLELPSLLSIYSNLIWAGRSVGQNTFDAQEYLLQIRDILAAQGESEEEQLGALLRIAAVIAGVPTP